MAWQPHSHVKVIHAYTSSISSFQRNANLELKNMLPIVVESPKLEIHCLSLETNLHFEDDSKSECPSDYKRNFITIVNNLVVLSYGLLRIWRALAREALGQRL